MLVQSVAKYYEVSFSTFNIVHCSQLHMVTYKAVTIWMFWVFERH